jgi:DNA-binding transcriptional LysR family regulator
MTTPGCRAWQSGISGRPPAAVNEVDLDLAQVRAFVATAERLHFGRAAEHLSLSQQALSKRIARLEDTLGVRLFTRDPIELTEAGRRFLEPAARALAAGDLAVAAARREERPLRIDVWGHMYVPTRTVREALAELPGLDVELGTSRDLPAAVTSLRRGEIDVGFGRVHPPADGGPLTHRLVRLEPVDVVMSAEHPFAREGRLRPADLRGVSLWFPAAKDRLDFLSRFSDHFGVPGEFGGVNLGPGALAEHLRADPGQVSLLPADAPLPPGLRAVPLVDPTPLYAWSLLWRRDEPHPLLPPLLRGFAETGRRRRWLEYDPAADWLPDVDRADFEAATAEPVT